MPRIFSVSVPTLSPWQPSGCSSVGQRGSGLGPMQGGAEAKKGLGAKHVMWPLPQPPDTHRHTSTNDSSSTPYIPPEKLFEKKKKKKTTSDVTRESRKTSPKVTS